MFTEISFNMFLGVSLTISKYRFRNFDLGQAITWTNDDQDLESCGITGPHWVISLRPSDPTQDHRTWSTLVQVMACYLKAPSHKLNQCWFFTSEVLETLNSLRPSVTHICVGNLTIIGSDNQCCWNMVARSPNATHESTGRPKVPPPMARLATNEFFRFCRKYFRMDITFTDIMCPFVLAPK